MHLSRNKYPRESKGRPARYTPHKQKFGHHKTNVDLCTWRLFAWSQIPRRRNPSIGLCNINNGPMSDKNNGYMTFWIDLGQEVAMDYSDAEHWDLDVRGSHDRNRI